MHGTKISFCPGFLTTVPVDTWKSGIQCNHGDFGPAMQNTGASPQIFIDQMLHHMTDRNFMWNLLNLKQLIAVTCFLDVILRMNYCIANQQAVMFHGSGWLSRLLTL